MALFFPRKRILLAGNEGISLFRPTSNNGIEREIALSWEVPNFNQQLTNALTRQNQNSPLLILFDADHAYRKGEGIPKLSFFDRSLFIKRKLDQAFPNYPVRASFEIAAAKKKNGPKEDPTYLFVAISETERLDKLARSILEAGVPVAGLGLLPIESEGLVTALSAKLFGHKGKNSRWVVLIGQHETGGLRQVVVKDGRLALTRMTPVSEAGLQGAGWVEEVMREFKATLTYIARFGYTPAEGLDVIVIGGEAEKQLFEQQKFLPGSNFQCVKVVDALKAIGVRGSSLEAVNFGDALHAAWSSQKKFLTAPVRVESIHRIRMPRLAARIASIALFVSLFVLLGVTFSVNQDYGPLKEKVEQKQSQKRLLSLEYEQESKVFDAFPVKPTFIKQALSVNKTLDDNSVNIGQIFELLYKTFNSDVKDFKLGELGVEYQPALLQDRSPGNPGLLSLKKTGNKAGPEPRGTVNIRFRFYITGNMPLEQKASTSEKMVEKLKAAFPGYSVVIKTQFGNLTSSGNFFGEFGKTPESLPRQNPADSFAEIEMQGAPL